MHVGAGLVEATDDGDGSGAKTPWSGPVFLLQNGAVSTHKGFKSGTAINERGLEKVKGTINSLVPWKCVWYDISETSRNICTENALTPSQSIPQHGGTPGGGGTPYVMGDTYVPRFWPPFFTLAGSSTIFLGYFSHPPTAKLSFGVQKLPIFTKIDLFGPKFNFFLDLFGSNFQRPAAHPHQFSGRVPTPGEGPSHSLICQWLKQCFFFFFLFN